MDFGKYGQIYMTRLMASFNALAPEEVWGQLDGLTPAQLTRTVGLGAHGMLWLGYQLGKRSREEK